MKPIYFKALLSTEDRTISGHYAKPKDVLPTEATAASS